MSTIFNFQQRQQLVQCRDASDDLHNFVRLNALAKVSKETLTLVSDKLHDSLELVTIRERFDGLLDGWFR